VWSRRAAEELLNRPFASSTRRSTPAPTSPPVTVGHHRHMTLLDAATVDELRAFFETFLRAQQRHVGVGGVILPRRRMAKPSLTSGRFPAARSASLSAAEPPMTEPRSSRSQTVPLPPWCWRDFTPRGPRIRSPGPGRVARILSDGQSSRLTATWCWARKSPLARTASKSSRSSRSVRVRPAQAQRGHCRGARGLAHESCCC